MAFIMAIKDPKEADQEDRGKMQTKIFEIFEEQSIEQKQIIEQDCLK